MKLDRFEKACCGAMLLLATLLGLASALLAGIGLQPAAPSPVPVYICDALYLKGEDDQLYRNAGTGAFGYGNDLKYPIPAE